MQYNGCVIGTRTTGYEINAPVVLSRDDLKQHLHLIGKTGTGKSTLLKTLLYDDLLNDRDFVLIDPLGTLAEAIVDGVPANRTNDVIYFAPGHDLEHCVGINPLWNVPPDLRHLVADHIVASFMHIWNASLEDTPRLVYVLYHSIRLLLDAPDGETLLGLPRLLVNDNYRAFLLKHSRDLAVIDFWRHEFPKDEKIRANVIGPIQNKIGMLLAPPPLRNVLGQRRSTLNIARLMNERGTLICNLAKGKLGETTTKLMGALIATAVAQVAEERISIAPEERRPICLYVDEIQNVATSAFAGVLSELRNFNLSLIASHQYLAQLPDELQEAVLNNCANSVVFRAGAGKHTRRLADELDLENDKILSSTPNYKAWTKLLRNGVPSEAFLMDTVQTEPPARDRKDAVIAHTRTRHTRPRAAVEAEIAKNMGREQRPQFDPPNFIFK